MTFPLDNLSTPTSTDPAFLPSAKPASRQESESTFRSHLSDSNAERPEATTVDDDGNLAPAEPATNDRSDQSHEVSDEKTDQRDENDEPAPQESVAEQTPDENSAPNAPAVFVDEIPTESATKSADAVPSEDPRLVAAQLADQPVDTENAVDPVQSPTAIRGTESPREPGKLPTSAGEEHVATDEPIKTTTTSTRPGDSATQQNGQPTAAIPEEAKVTDSEAQPRREKFEQPAKVAAEQLSVLEEIDPEPVTATVSVKRDTSDSKPIEPSKPQESLPENTTHQTKGQTDQPNHSPANRFAEHLVGRAGGKSEIQPQETGVDQNRFIQRVVRAFRAADNQNGEVRLRLSPPDLGSLRLEIKLQKGALTARIESETTVARTLLLENLPLLRERLSEQGIRVENFDVDVSDRQPGNLPDGPTDQGDSQRHQAAGPASAETESTTDPLSTQVDPTSQPSNRRQINVVV